MCKFCEALERHRKVDTIIQKNYPEDEYRYSVAIVRRLFVRGFSGCRATSTDYRYRSCGFKLNFCPECGRKLAKNSAIDGPAETP